MATSGTTPDFAKLSDQNRMHSPMEREHASAHFLCRLPHFLAEDVHLHEQTLVLNSEGEYQPHHVIRIKPLGEENHGYLLLPIDKQDHRIKLAFRSTDHFEQYGDHIDSFNAIEDETFAFILNAIHAHYGIGVKNLEMTVAGSPNQTASNQYFIRGLIKQIARTKHFDNVSLLKIDNLTTFEEQDTSDAACYTFLEDLIPNKSLQIQSCLFGKIASHLIQKEAYAHIFYKKPATLKQIEAANKQLPPHILAFASAHLLSSYSYYLASKGRFHDKEVLMLREDGTYQPYQVIQLPLVLGMFGYILLPTDTNDKTIRITFRGTDFADIDSALINLEKEGPSSTSFPSVKNEVMSCLKQAIQQHYGKDAKDLKITISGHSQGASTSQLFASAFLEERIECADFDGVSELSLTTFNDPGVSTEARVKADNLALLQPQLGKPIRIKANFGRVDGDVVQILGEDMMFVRLPYPIVETTLLKVDKELGEKYQDLTEKLSNAHYLNTFFSMLDPDGSVRPAKIQIEHNNRTYTNQTAAGHAFIQDEMLYKIQKTVNVKKQLHRVADKLPLSYAKSFIENFPLTRQECLYLGIEPLEHLKDAGCSYLYAAGYGAYIGNLCYEAYKVASDLCDSSLLSQPKVMLSQYKDSLINWYKGTHKEASISLSVNRNGILQEEPCSSSASSSCKRT